MWSIKQPFGSKIRTEQALSRHLPKQHSFLTYDQLYEIPIANTYGLPSISNNVSQET